MEIMGSISHLFTIMVPRRRLRVGEPWTGGSAQEAPKRCEEAWNGWFRAGRRRSGGLGGRRGLADWRPPRERRLSARRLAGLLHRRFQGGGFRRGRFVY